MTAEVEAAPIAEREVPIVAAAAAVVDNSAVGTAGTGSVVDMAHHRTAADSAEDMLVGPDIADSDSLETATVAYSCIPPLSPCPWRTICRTCRTSRWW